MFRWLAIFAVLLAASPLHAEILGMQVKRAVSEAEMIASLPKIALVDEKGAPFDLRGVLSSGKPTLVTLWAHWCPNCRSEIPGFKAIADKCADHWNIAFVSARRSDYPKDIAAYRKFGLPWKFYNVSKAVETDPAQARVARAFFGETADGGVVTPQHYLISASGAVDAIVSGKMDFADPKRLAVFCTQ